MLIQSKDRLTVNPYDFQVTLSLKQANLKVQEAFIPDKVTVVPYTVPINCVYPTKCEYCVKCFRCGLCFTKNTVCITCIQNVTNPHVLEGTPRVMDQYTLILSDTVEFIGSQYYTTIKGPNNILAVLRHQHRSEYFINCTSNESNSTRNWNTLQLRLTNSQGMPLEPGVLEYGNWDSHCNSDIYNCTNPRCFHHFVQHPFHPLRQWSVLCTI
jgi:hypothetical protein